jgi:hypothetical protein
MLEENDDLSIVKIGKIYLEYAFMFQHEKGRVTFFGGGF